MSVQYRLMVAKKDERVEGPDDADLTITVPLSDAREDDFDATVAFMRGRLKAAGHTGELLDVLQRGEVDAAVARLVDAV